MALFDSDEEYLLVIGRAIHGPEGVFGLRRTANCLFDEVHHGCDQVERKLVSTTLKKMEGKAGTRLAAIKKGVEQERKVPGVRFVLCYHLRGTAECNLAWSQAVSNYNALEAGCSST